MAMKASVIHIGLSLLLLSTCASSQKCTHPQTTISSENYGFIKAHDLGDSPASYLYIGGMFGVHHPGEHVNSCGELRSRGFHSLEAFLWAVRTFKDRYPSLLADINIGALVFDSCSNSFHLLQQFANFHQCLLGYGTPTIDPSTVLAYVGPDRSGEAMELAEYIGTDGPPVVSHAATSSSLSNKDAFPHFLRTVPSDSEQVKALVDILVLKDWKNVQLVHSDNAYGHTGKRSFMVEAERADICIVNSQQIPSSLDEDRLTDILDSLNDNHETRAVVVFANEDIARVLLQTASKTDSRGLFTWFGTTAWATNSEVTQGVEEVAEGAVTLALESNVPLEFREYIDTVTPLQNHGNPWFKEYWSDKFRCYFADAQNPNGYVQLCDDLQSSLSDVALDTYVPYTIQAVDAVLLAVDRARKELCSLSSDGLCDELIWGDKWPKIFDGIKGLKRDAIKIFNTSTGDPLDSSYEVYNYRARGGVCTDHCYEQIGEYNTRTDVLNLQVANIHSYDPLGERVYGATSTCAHTPCTVCGEMFVPTTTTLLTDGTSVDPAPGSPGSSTEPTVALRSESWVIPLIALAAIGVLLVIILDIILLSKIFGTPYMKHWRTMWLGQLLLVGILLCYLTLFAFILTPTKATCGIIRFGVGVSYAMCFSVLLVKLLIVLSSESVGELKGVFQILMFLFAWGVQIAVDSELLVLRIPGTMPSPDDPSRLVCQHGDFKSHVQSLVYVMFLIFVCTVMAIKTHKISTNHREGVFIGICAGFTIPVWLVWILLGMFYGDSAAHDPCLAFGLFTTATLLLFVMFLPKVRQLNSMGVEGIYAEDDGPDYAASVGHLDHVATGPPSVIGYAPSKAVSEGSIILVQNGEVHKEPHDLKPIYTTGPGPYPLHLRHPPSLQRLHQSYDSVSVQSAPLGPTYMVRRTRPRAADTDNIQASTRVLRMTNDLTGRRTPVSERRTNSEFNQNVVYGEQQAGKGKQSTQGSDVYKPSNTVGELGSL